MRNGSDSGLPELVINVIANLVARWRKKITHHQKFFPHRSRDSEHFLLWAIFNIFSSGTYFFAKKVIKIVREAKFAEQYLSQL